jgi:Trk-type K+ transport system membrane component
MAHRSQGSRSRLIAVGFWLSTLAALVGLAWTVTTTVLMIKSGHALDEYRSVWLVQDSWIGIAVFGVAVIATLLVELLMRLAHQRRETKNWRELDQD